MKKATRPAPVVLAQKDVKPVARMSDAICGAGSTVVASLIRATDEGFVQHSSMNRAATIAAPTNRTTATGISARKSVISHAPANHATDHVATRAASLAPRGSAPTGGTACANEITAENSTQLKMTSG